MPYQTLWVRAGGGCGAESPDELNRRARAVHCVVTIYHYFLRPRRRGPAGIRLVHASEACQSMKCARSEAHAKDRLAIHSHETTAATGAFSLIDPGYCSCGTVTVPARLLDDDDEQLIWRVTHAALR